MILISLSILIYPFHLHLIVAPPTLSVPKRRCNCCVQIFNQKAGECRGATHIHAHAHADHQGWESGGKMQTNITHQWVQRDFFWGGSRDILHRHTVASEWELRCATDFYQAPVFLLSTWSVAKAKNGERTLSCWILSAVMVYFQAFQTTDDINDISSFVLSSELHNQGWSERQSLVSETLNASLRSYAPLLIYRPPYKHSFLSCVASVFSPPIWRK